jgi:hypothetical protein
MVSRRRKWILAVVLSVVVATIALFVIASMASKRYQPYIRDAAIRYLRERFESEVELGDLQIHLPKTSSLRMIMTRGRGTMAEVVGSNLTLRHMGRRDVPPMFAIKRFQFTVDLGLLFGPTKKVALVQLDGMEINVPPKGERPDLTPGDSGAEAGNQSRPNGGGVLIEEVRIHDAVLVILPKDQSKIPLRFDIQRLRMESVSKNDALDYDADLTNPKPPGVIHSEGSFGPWSADRPSDTPLTGDYTFEKADLGVFKGIAGILDSRGQFEGTLGRVRARGQAKVPDFRLKSVNHPVPLATSFDVVVDGTNGNTILSPVVATLGSSRFTTSGGVIKRVKGAKRTISLDVVMPKGQLKDLLRLAMKGEPFMEGQIALKTGIGIPPLDETVKEKLELDGRFQVSDGRFLRSTVQDQIDTLSRRGQGQPKNEAIDEVFANMGGAFTLDDQIVRFQRLSFAVPGAAVNLTGNFDIDQDQLDFHGALRLQAKISQTVGGWKRWALKVADPFFAKNGAGTFLRIKVEGSSKTPKFGLDRGSKKKPEETTQQTSAARE